MSASTRRIAPCALALSLAGLLLWPSADSRAQDCRLFGNEAPFRAERSAVVDAGGSELLRVEVGPGRLVIDGQAGLTEVRIKGRACAGEEELLDLVQLVAERRGIEVYIEAIVPDRLGGGSGGSAYAELDLYIEVPQYIAANITDTSGSVELSHLGPIELDDESGSVRIEDGRGTVRIDDASGSITVSRLQGDLLIDDESGSIDVSDIEGSVEIRDGSGSIDVADVSGVFRLVSDTSGTVSTRGVDMR